MKLTAKGMNKSAGVQEREAQEKQKGDGWASICAGFRTGAEATT
jgi:hypothetical protein